MPAPSAAPIVHSGQTKAATIHAASAGNQRSDIAVFACRFSDRANRTVPQTQTAKAAPSLGGASVHGKCGAQADRKGG